MVYKNKCVSIYYLPFPFVPTDNYSLNKVEYINPQSKDIEYNNVYDAYGTRFHMTKIRAWIKCVVTQKDGKLY